MSAAVALRLDALGLAARASLGRRVRFSALDACAKHVCVGANTGSMYCFQTGDMSLARIVPFSSYSGDGSEAMRSPECIDHVRFRYILVLHTCESPGPFSRNTKFYFNRDNISPSGELLALALQSGRVFILELKLDAPNERVRIVGAFAHHTERVTCLCWDAGGRRLFTADAGGTVLVCFLHRVEPTIGLLGISSLFEKDKLVWALDGPVRAICKADSRVAQLDVFESRLLVASQTRVVIVDLEKPTEAPKQVCLCVCVLTK